MSQTIRSTESRKVQSKTTRKATSRSKAEIDAEVIALCKKIMKALDKVKADLGVLQQLMKQ